MAENNAIDEAYLQSLTNQQTSALDNVLAQQTETLDQLVNRKKEDLGLKSEEKTNDFISQNISINDIADADTLFNLGRLYGGEGDLSFDAYETAKYDDNNELIPYLGSIEPKDGSKRSKKWNLHRKAYAKMNGIRDYTMVSQRMLNEEAAKQTENFKAALLKGQDPNSGQIAVDIRQDGEGYFGRPLITVRNPKTGEIINEVMNTADNNAMFYSNYNKDAYIEGVLKLEEATTNYNERKYSGEGFWVSAAKGLSQGVDGLQATGWGMGALIADAIGGKRGEAAATWFIEQYLRELDEAQANGAGLPSVENVDWSDPNEALSKFGALLGEAMPSIALMIGTGGLAGLIAKATQAGTKAGVKRLVKNEVGDRAAKIIARSQAAGAYGAAMVMETGSIYGDVAAAGERDSKAIWGSLAGGTIAGALEAFYPVKLMKKFGLSKAKVNKSTNDRILANNLKENFQAIGAGLLTGGAQEGTTEMLQFVVEEITQDLIKEGHLPDFNSAEFKSGLLNSFVAGLVPGSTLSGGASLVSETRNRIRGDEGATQQSVNESRQEVLKAVNEESVGEANVQSIENTAVNINNIENSAGSLGIELNDSYRKNKSVADKASWLADALNQLEIEQKSLPKGERNTEVIKARKAIEKALNNLNTGSASISRQAKEQVINQRAARARIGVTSKKALRDIAKKQEIDLKLLETKQTRYNKKGVEVLTKQIDTEIKKINSINEQLKDPNLSKAKIKNLKRLRNQLGVKVDKLSKDNDGTKLVDLDSQVFKNIDTVLDSFEFQNRKSKLREDSTIAEDLKEVVEDTEKTGTPKLERLGANTIKVLENPKSTNDQRANAINEFSKLYRKAESVINKIEKELETVTDPKERKALKKALKDVNRRLDNVSKTVELLTKEESTVKETDVLYSLNPLTSKQIEELKKLEGLSKTEQALLDAHIEVYKTKQEVDDNKKDIDDVRNDVLVGEKAFQGFMHYLKLAQKKSSSAVSNIKEFLNLLNDKLNRFKDAQKILKDENIKTVWISKNNYQDPILRTMPTIEKDGKQVEDKDNYFFVNAKSVKLMQSIKEEIEFGEAVLALITKATNKTTTKEKAALDKATKEAAESQVKKPVTDKDLDDIKTEDVKIETTDPVSKEELAKLINNIKILKDKARKANEDASDIKDNAQIEIFYAETVIPAKIAVLKAEIAYDKALNKNKPSKTWEKSIANNEAKITKFEQEIAEILKDSTEQSAAAANNTKSKVNHFLNKAGQFLKLYRTKLRGSDIFKIAQPKRESFYSKNSLDGSTKVKELLKDYLGKDFKDDKFIENLDKYFYEFKNSFEKHNRKVKTKKGDSSTAFHNQEFLQLLYVEIDGVKTLPDEVIFAMMLSTLQYMSINNFNTEVTTEQQIGVLLYNDMQADLSREELEEFSNMGILFKDASSEIGNDAFNNLNLKIDTSKLQGDNLNEVINNIDSFIKENGSGFLPSDLIAEQLKIALGGTALAVATSIHPHNKNPKGLDGLVEIVYTTYHHDTFDGTPNEDLKEGDYRLKKPTRLMKTIKFPYLQMKKVPFELEELFESIKDNKETINKINGTDSELSGPLAKASKNIQKFVRGSFIAIPEKTRNVMTALHKVPWLGKKKALDLWKMTDESTRERVVGIVDLEEKHVTERPGFETSNQDKLKDIKLVDAYDGKPFWFKYSAQKQNRINIDSSGINGQRSKIHRSFFMPKSSNVLIDSEFKRAMYQLGIAQAFGYGIDKHTLQDSLLAFDKLYEQSRDLVEYLKSGNVKEEQYNILLNELLDKKGIDASAHVIEAIASLTSYKPTGSFKSESLGIETDGITNGYAIAQLQLLGVPLDSKGKELSDDETVASLVDSLARIGVFIEPGMTMEKFIKSGKLDVYQTLAFFIKDTLSKKSALDTINQEKLEWVNEITKEQIAALDIVHGEIWTEKDNEGILTREITKFGRNLAKNPLMISGYGAEIARIISALAADAIPTINNKLAEFQVEFDNAKTTREKKTILNEFTIYVEALDQFIPGAAARLPNQLKKGDLRIRVFNKKQVQSIELAYQAIFTPAITTALGQFTKPLEKARNAIIQSGEWQYTSFMFYFDRAIKDYKRTAAFKNSPSKLVPLEVERAIADKLALKYMPLIYGEWSDPDTPLQIIKTARIDGNQDLGRVVIPVPRKVFPMILKNGYKFEAIKDKDGKNVTDDTYSLDSHANARKYVAPGVSAYTNYIQNADSVLIGKLILENPNVLTIFDAAMSDIETAYSNNTNYNEGFRESGLTYSMLETALKRLIDVKSAIEPGDLKAIEKIYKEGKEEDGKVIYEPSYQAKGLLDLIEKTSESDALQAEYDALSFQTLEDTFNEEIKRVKDMRMLLNRAFGTKDKDGKTIKDSWLKNATISQMYLPESLKLIENGSETIESIKAGASIDVEAETVTKPEQEIAESQVDPEDATTTEIEEETQQAEPEELTEEVGPAEQEEATEGDPYVLFQDDKGNDVFTNAGQTNAINRMKEWWQSDEKMFVLAGRGGTGKTTIVDKTLDELKVDKNGVIIALPTHKALQVIEEITQGSAGDYMTLASLLGLEKKWNSEKREYEFIQSVDKYAKNLKNFEAQGVELIVVDEVSMVTEQQAIQLVQLTKSKNEGGLGLKIIFMGDNVQLPPIEDSKSNIGLSTIFDNVMGFNNKANLGINPDNYVKLTKRMRQGEESPILGITDILANTIEWIFQNPKLFRNTDSGFILPKVPENNKHEGVHYMKGTDRYGLTDETLDKFVEEYKKDPANVKYIHYNKESNKRTISIRSRIREKLFPNVKNSGDLKALPFIKGERIVIGDTAVIVKDNKTERSTELTNGQEVVVIEELVDTVVTAQTTGDYGRYFDKVPVRILQVKDDNDMEYSVVFEHPRTIEVIKRQLSPTAQWSARKKVIPEITSGEVAAAYLINTHKAQGSTYKTVYADYENFMGTIGPPQWLAKMQALYVATSRPSERLVLVGTGDLAFGEDGKDLNENIEILKNLENNEESSPKDSDELYSLDNDLDIEMKALWDTDSVANTAQNIFNKLSNHFKSYYPTKEEQSTQESHLQRVLDEIILPTGNALDNVSVELFAADVKAFGAVSLKNKNISVVLNNKKPSSFSEQTAQEAYVHELIHIITNSPLAKNASFRDDITRIRNSVKAELEKMDRPYEIFLHKDADGNIITLTDAKTEIAAAKEQYNYLFGPKKSEFILDEFLAYSLTNKHLVRELSKIPAKVVPLWNKESDAHVLEKIIDFFTELVKRFVNVMQKKPISGTLDKEIFQITKEMVNASHSQAGKVRNILQRQNFAKDYDKANEAASTFLKDMVSRGVKFGSDQYIKGVDKLTKDGKINNFFANVLYDSKLAVLMTSSYGKFINDNPKVQRYLDAAFKNFKPGLKQNLASLKADAFGGVNEDFIRLLYKSQKEVDVARRQYKQLTGESLLNEFKDLDSLTKEEKEAITRVLFKSDFSTLVATETYSMEDAIRLLNDDTYLDEQITKYAKDLDIKNDNHYATQTKSLAEWMMVGNQFNTNQFKNAHVIYDTNPSKPKGTVEDLDIYITLLALRNHVEPYTKNQIKNVVNREFKLDKDHNGITNTIYHHIAFKENALEQNFTKTDDAGNKIVGLALVSKGYIADITNPNIQIEFAGTDAETQKLMEEADYEFISGFETITGVNDSQYGIYVNRNLPDAMRTKGIASVTSKHFAGSSFKEIMSRNPATEGQINLLFRRFKEQQTKKQNTLDNYHTMMPLLNEKGEIVDYTIHMNHVFKEKILEQELAFDQVLPTMYSHSLDKASSEKINREAIDLLDTHTTLNYDKEPQKYINLLEGENREEYFNVLPRDARNHILDLAKKNKDKKLAFYVERKLLDTVFGYKMPSIGNAPIIRSNKKIQKQIKIAEKMMFELVALSKVNIVIKIPAVLGFNIVSNFMTSMIYGIPPTYLLKKWREGFKELERYQKEHKKLQLLELKQVGNPSLRNDPKIENDKKIIIKSLNDNKVAKLMDMGLFNSITEDINKNDFTYRHQTMNTLRNTKIGKKFDNRFKGKAVKLANQAYIGEETALFKTMMHLTQASDFIARYAMYSHAIEVKNMDENKAFKQMVETFVNYDQPLNRYLQYGNDIGLLFFVKYWLRIQRATFNIAKEKPLNIGMLYVGNTMLGLDIESIMESSILTGNFFPSTGGPLKVIEEIVMLPGLEILSGESLGLG